MTIQKADRLRVLTLLSIERDQVAEQLAMIGCGDIKPAPMVVRGKLPMRLWTFGLTDKTRPASI